MHQNKNKNKHQPVLLDETLRYLAPQAGESYLDLTAGYGGHAAAVLEQTRRPELATLVDRDALTVAELERLFGRLPKPRIWQLDFLAASQKLVEESEQFDLILADLGLSSPHLNEVNRGFSFMAEAPLDMRMDQGQTLTAEQIVNGSSEAELASILTEYGEEPKARQIAKMIVRHRPIRTTSELASVVAKAWPGHSRVHPATRSFQAIRIAVNDELGQISNSLPLWLKLLKPGGRLAVISFHSLEDRLVKQFFAEQARAGYEAELKLLTKHPVTASHQETVNNPRARSAKLRAAVKINNPNRKEH